MGAGVLIVGEVGGWNSAIPRNGTMVELRGYLAAARFEGLLGLDRFSGGQVRRSGEVIGDGVQGIGFGFGKGTAELVLNAINDMKKQAPVHVQLAAAESPVGAEYEMVAEYALLKFIEHPPANNAEVGQEFLPLPGVAPPALTAGTEVQRDGSHVRNGGAFAEAVVTSSKDGPEYALAGYFLACADDPDSVPMAMGA